MRKFLLIFVLILVSCGYSFNIIEGVSVKIHSVEVKTSLFPGIEAEIDNRLMYDLQKHGVGVSGSCPEIFLSLISPSANNYFFTKEGKVSQVDVVAVYSVKIVKCNGKTLKRVYKIPFNFSYYSDPKKSNASERVHIIGSVDGLVSKLLNDIK
jgi:hypothetical protein